MLERGATAQRGCAGRSVRGAGGDPPRGRHPAAHPLREARARPRRLRGVASKTPLGQLDEAAEHIASQSSALAVDLSPMSDSSDEHEPLRVFHCVDDAVVADSDPVVVPSCELHDAERPGIHTQSIYRVANPVSEWALQATELPRRSWMQSDLVRRLGYSRTSTHGTAASRSSRACSAARLSSKYSSRSIRSA